MTLQERIDLANSLCQVTKEDNFLCAVIHHYVAVLLQIKQTGNNSDLQFFNKRLEESIENAIKRCEQEQT